jgi:hypothetical protein
MHCYRPPLPGSSPRSFAHTRKPWEHRFFSVTRGVRAVRQRGSGAGEGGGAGGVEKIAGVFADVAVAEDGVAGNQEICASTNDIGDRGEIDATVDFNAIGKTPRLPRACQRLDFAQRALDEVLAAESGIHGHHQHVVHEVEDFVEHVHRCGGIDDYRGLTSVRGNQVKRAIEVNASLLMDRYPVGAGFREGRNEIVGILDHQVAIEGNIGNGFAERGHHRRADGDVRNEVAVHDVHVEDRAAAVDGGLGLRAKLSEIGGENGGSEFDQRTLLSGRAESSMI